jgi:hypothetical protein
MFKKKLNLYSSYIVIIFLLHLAISPVYSKKIDNSKWGWFSADSSKNGWFINKGIAVVKIINSTIYAELYFNDLLMFKLKGSFKRNGRVDVTAFRISTGDTEKKMLIGLHKIIKFNHGNYSRESIILTEKDEPSGLTIGLTRDLP